MHQICVKSPKKLDLKRGCLAQLRGTQSKLRGTKPSRTCGMCPRLQKHSDWWVWITEQYIPLHKSGFTLLKRGFWVFVLHKLPIFQEGFFSLTKQVSLRALIKQQNHNTTPRWKALVAQLVLGGFAWWVTSELRLSALLSVILQNKDRQPEPRINNKSLIAV